MDLKDFKAITAEIDNRHGGEGCVIDVFTTAGTAFRSYAWQRLSLHGTIDTPFSVIVLKKDNEPHCYMPLSSIIAIQESK